MKYCQEIIEEICGYIEKGNFNKDAAMLAGIGESTFYEWKDKPEFAEAIKKAESKCKNQCIQEIRRAGKEQWQATAWFLERKYPKEFGRKILGTEDEPIQIIIKEKIVDQKS